MVQVWYPEPTQIGYSAKGDEVGAVADEERRSGGSHGIHSDRLVQRLKRQVASVGVLSQTTPICLLTALLHTHSTC